MKTFKELNLPAALQDAIANIKFTTPTPIQAQAIPLALQGKDVMGCAQTGTGKTAAFAIPILAQLLESETKGALILTPTRELAAQVVEVFESLTQNIKGLKPALLIGGAGMQPQNNALRRRPRIIVATPGRLIDHLQRKGVILSQTEILVLDEADRMLDMGFAPQLDAILEFTPRRKQTLLFSATFDANVEKLSGKYLNSPERISVASSATPIEKIKQKIVQTTAAAKKQTLLSELEARAGSVLIFSGSKHRTDHICNFLLKSGYRTIQIHGDRSQNQRTRAIEGFRSGKFDILVATDIAARGLDIPHIAHVINYDLPRCAEDYVHRIGRTARAGAEGEALSFIMPEDYLQWQKIIKLTGQTGLQIERPHRPSGPTIVNGISLKQRKAGKKPPFSSGRKAKPAIRKQRALA
jgi:ATP-dependent RNA helicase DeaD